MHDQQLTTYHQTSPYAPYAGNLPLYDRSAFQYGSFLRRFVASFVDGIIIGLCIVIAAEIVKWTLESIFNWGPRMDETVAIVAGILQAAYFVIGTSKGGTWGYRALGLRVTSRQGTNPDLTLSFIREWYQVLSVAVTAIASLLFVLGVGDRDPENLLLAGFGALGVLSIATFIWFMGCFVVLFDEHKQAMHDKLADTFVIRMP